MGLVATLRICFRRLPERLFETLGLCLLILSWCPIRASGQPSLDLQLVTGSVTNPVYVTHAGDGSKRLFIVEQAGRIKIHDGTMLLSPPFLDITGIVLTGGEQGLLSVAFHPGYPTNGLFYVYYTDLNGNLAIARYNVSANPSLADATSGVVLLNISHPGQSNHNGGQLQFGPDGFLYIAPGDGGSGCDPPNNAQNLNSLLGKILRIDINTNQAYRIPPTNPFVGVAGLDEIWAYGLRNPWRFSFDRVTGDLFIADVGQGTREEVSFQPASSVGGENYGWKCIEGTTTNTCSFACPGVIAVPPILEYSRNPNRSVTGGYRYRGTRILPLIGTYIFADYFNPAPIWGATNTTSGAWNTNLLLTAAFNISSFGEDKAGELYVCRHSGTVGAIYRVVWKDTDGDGMADDWENEFGLNPNSAVDASFDLDGDGFMNLQEFLADTRPNDPASALRIVSVTRAESSVSIGFTTSSNRSYRVERRADLLSGNWNSLTNNVGGTGGVVAVTDSDAGIAARYHYRAVVEQD